MLYYVNFSRHLNFHAVSLRSRVMKPFVAEYDYMHKCKQAEISLSPMSQMRDLTKGASFVPAVPERSLRSLKGTVDHKPRWWSTQVRTVCAMLWVCCGCKHQADCENSDHHRRTGRNEPGFAEWQVCDWGLSESSRFVSLAVRASSQPQSFVTLYPFLVPHYDW